MRNILTQQGLAPLEITRARSVHPSLMGFTLVEMIVSIGLFTVVLFVSSSAFLSVLNADRKSRATRIAMDNLNLSLEDMSRSIKTGYRYDCGLSGAPTDCGVAAAASQFNFYGQDGAPVTYTRVGTGITRQTGSGQPLIVTAPEIEITNLQFVVGGTAVGPSLGGTNVAQPYVVILVNGKTKGTVISSFKIQTMVTQRAYDI